LTYDLCANESIPNTKQKKNKKQTTCTKANKQANKQTKERAHTAHTHAHTRTKHTHKAHARSTQTSTKQRRHAKHTAARWFELDAGIEIERKCQSKMDAVLCKVTSTSPKARSSLCLLCGFPFPFDLAKDACKDKDANGKIKSTSADKSITMGWLLRLIQLDDQQQWWGNSGGGSAVPTCNGGALSK
jgi:hypothetical protein